MMNDVPDASAADLKKDLHRLQSQMIAQEADLKKKEAEKNLLDAEIIRLNHTVATARAEMEEKTQKVKKVERDLSFLKDETARTKKKLMTARAQHRTRR